MKCFFLFLVTNVCLAITEQLLFDSSTEISTGSANPPIEWSQYKIISPNTVNVRIDDMFVLETTRLKDTFKTVDYLCATADIWSTKHKSYMGVTVHWVDAKTLERKSNVLCCRRFESPHTGNRIATMLNAVYNEFNIGDKILVTVTDNASNFVKAFKDFGISMETFASFVAAQNKHKPTDLNASLYDGNCSADEYAHFLLEEEENEQIFFTDIEGTLLSDHFRCGCHTFCLLASTDAKDAFTNVAYADRYRDVFDKVKALYRKTNKPKSSEIIKRILKKSLILPAPTRWNSLFDSIEHILSFELVTLNILMLELGLPQFTLENYDFLKEFLKVMEGVAFAVDNLQSSKSYYAIFLPTLHSIMYMFDDLEMIDLEYCDPLLQTIKAGFNRRFDKFFNRYDEHCIAATIASATHPHFKLRWLYKRYQTKEYSDYIRELLIEKAMDIAVPNQNDSSSSNGKVASKKTQNGKFLFKNK